jgi:hypothetical protein
MTDEKVRDKLKKLWAKAKSAKDIGSEHEAHAFAAKVQELLSYHKIGLSEIEYQSLDEVDPIGRREVNFASAGFDIKKSRIHWQEILADIVARTYFCKVAIITGSSRIFLIGRGTDAEQAEQVFLYLLRVAKDLAEKAYVKYFYECKREGNVEKARGFTSSYLKSFTARLSQRFAEEKRRMEEEAAASGTSLIRLTDAMKSVEEFVAASLGTRVASKLTGHQSRNLEGAKQGREAASRLAINKDKKQVESGV